MTRSMLEDAFAHHVWATLQVIDSCLGLTPEQLGTNVVGTYGSILETARHLVGADSGYLSTMTGGRVSRIDEERMDLRELRSAIERNEAAWSALVTETLDPDAIVVRHRDDGSEVQAP